MGGPRQIVEPPQFTPTPYGLLTVVQWPPSADDRHWRNGITYAVDCPMPPGSTYDECIAITGTGEDPPPTPDDLASTFSRTLRGATAFTVFQEFDCAPVGNEQARQAAQAALTATESWQAERSFWSGLSGGQTVVFPHLAADTAILETSPTTGPTVTLQTAATVVTGGSLYNAAEALGVLEGALGDAYNGVGVIHVPTRAATALDAYGLLRTQGPQIRTLNGNLVAVGAGYPGTSPAGADPDPDTTWMYATGAIMGYRSGVAIRPSTTAQAIDKGENTIRLIAERTYVFGWDCAHLAVQAALGAPKGT